MYPITIEKMIKVIWEIRVPNLLRRRLGIESRIGIKWIDTYVINENKILNGIKFG